VTVKRQVSLVQACDDKRLFNVQLWPRQRLILEAVDRGDHRLFVICCGRRSGKSLLSSLVLLHACLLRDDLARFMRPGETRYAIGIATNLRQGRLLLQAARSVVEASPLLGPMLESATEDELRFTNGTCLAVFPCSSRGARGWPVCAFAMDECAHFLSESEGYQVADRVFGSMMPSLAQFGNQSRAVVSSSPYGSDGLFATLHAQASSGELPDALAFHFSSEQMNPTLDPALLRAEERRDPDGYQSEYLALFSGGGGAFVDASRFAPPVRDVDVSPEDLVGPVVVGCDAAFSGHDLFGVAVVGRDPMNRRRLVLAHVDGLRPRKAASFEERAVVQRELLDQVAAVCKRYGASAVIDQYAAAQVAHGLSRHGVSVSKRPMSAQSKTAAYTELRGRLYTDELDIPADPELLADLRRLRTKVTAGSSSVIVPRAGGSHGDRCQALAIACLRQAEFGAMGEERAARAGGTPITAGFAGEHEVGSLGAAPGLRPGLAPPAGWPGSSCAGTNWRAEQF
jgi:hypothetical protein